MKSFTVNKNDAGQRLDKFITKTVPNLPQSMLYKSIRTKNIKVNRKRGDISQRLCEGDVVEMYISDEFFAPAHDSFDFLGAGTGLDVVYEDENLLLLNKKAGLLCHPDDKEYVDTLIGRVKRYLYEKGEYNPRDESSFTPSLVNRIDRNTSGIVIAAKNAQTLRILNDKMKTREIKKYYLCIAHGEFKEKNRILEGWLVKDESKNTVKVFNHAVDGGKEIRTKYTVLYSRDGLSLLEIELLTGRTHQIRSQLSFIGHPLLGDGKYGSNKLNKKYGYKKQSLCSYKLRFAFETDAQELNYLNGKEFKLDDVWFCRAFYDGTL